MPVQLMNCPSCGKQASEYEPSKWQCLSCGSKFVYEPPPEMKVEKREVIVASQQEFQCAVCGGTFDTKGVGKYVCANCGAVVCGTRLPSGEGTCFRFSAKVCKLCYSKRQVLLLVFALIGIAFGGYMVLRMIISALPRIP